MEKEKKKRKTGRLN